MSLPLSDSDTDSIERLYKNFGTLADAKEKISEHTKEYLEILSAVKGSSKEKRLASQFIARFFKHFPSLSDRAIEAQLDLCEDDDVAIRKQAIKDLPALCRESAAHTHKIADILAQLMQTEDSSEMSMIHISLIQLLKNDARGALSGIFSQIDAGEDIIRERAIKFLTLKLRTLGKEVINKEIEDYLISKCKKVLSDDVTCEEFQHLMDVLSWTRLSQSVTGQQEMVDIAALQAGISQPLDTSDPDNESVEKLIHCFRYALPYFSSQVDSARFLKYMTEQVLGKLSEMTKDHQLEVLKIFAELSTHCGLLDDAPTVVDSVFRRVIEFVPVPDTEIDDVSQVEPSLEYSHIECLLYAYHRLLRQCPETISKDPDVLKDFRFRMQYLARGVQGYIKKLREALQGKSNDELRTDENKMKAIALKTTTNINSLIKDLFHSPPIFKTVISLSWKPASAVNPRTKDDKAVEVVSPGSKRHTPITFGNGSSESKVSRNDYNKSHREIYTPPSGKYSNKVSSYDPAMRGRGGGRFRGRGTRPIYRSNRGRVRRNF